MIRRLQAARATAPGRLIQPSVRWFGVTRDLADDPAGEAERSADYRAERIAAAAHSRPDTSLVGIAGTSAADELSGGEDVDGVAAPGVDAPLVAGAETVAGGTVGDALFWGLRTAGKRTRRT
jgi:hypothetical protein